MKNPFHTDTLEPDQPFCNRVAELKELTNHARNGMNVVLFAPRRYGKTSIVRRVQHQLQSEGICVIYAQFMRLVSVEDMVQRLAKAVITGLHEHESLLEKGQRWLRHFPSIQASLSFDPATGMPSVNIQLAKRQLSPLESLETILDEIGNVLRKENFQVCIALDEFQDIIDIKEPRVEALLREHIQRHRCSYFFLGSRRRVLLDIFNNKGRPFYQSAVMMELEPLPEGESTEFVMNQFALGGKLCPPEVAAKIVEGAHGYPYYLQAMSYRLFELCEDECSSELVDQAYKILVSNERYGYLALIQNLSSGQLKLLRAIAEEGQARVASTAFLQGHGLTLGGVQAARKYLSEQDYIEQDKKGLWFVVDPIFRDWLTSAF
mgnify:CR=1 FL=1